MPYFFPSFCLKPPSPSIFWLPSGNTTSPFYSFFIIYIILYLFSSLIFSYSYFRSSALSLYLIRISRIISLTHYLCSFQHFTHSLLRWIAKPCPLKNQPASLLLILVASSPSSASTSLSPSDWKKIFGSYQPAHFTGYSFVNSSAVRFWDTESIPNLRYFFSSSGDMPPGLQLFNLPSSCHTFRFHPVFCLLTSHWLVPDTMKWFSIMLVPTSDQDLTACCFQWSWAPENTFFEDCIVIISHPNDLLR